MIRINVAQQLKQAVGVTRRYHIQETVDETGDIIRGELELLRTDQGILVTGKLGTSERLICSRCLESFECHINLEIAEEYFPVIDIISGVPLSCPPGSFSIDEQNELCLDDAVRQYVLMAKPMKPLCIDDCKGLCDKCGFNLNKGSCNCTQEIDLRWAGLNKLTSVIAGKKQLREE